MKNSIIESRKNTRIIRNNIIAVLLSQAVIGIISYLTGVPVYAYLWGEMAENPSALFGSILSFLHVLFILYLYVITGRRFLKKADNKFATIISVWFLSMVLITCMALGFLLKSAMLLGVGTGIFNPISISIGMAFGAVKESTLGIPAEYYVYFLAPFLPSFGLWLGTIIKKRYKVGKPKTDKSIPVV